ncbi:hypothetical protein [Variovorax sp.]|uniref:hypothetical protein n=1 Tax=Variovorax sp. TaxID=1871043 RepID=UPI004037BAAA
MEKNRYTKQLEYFDLLLDAGVQVSARTVGMQPPEMRFNYLDRIFTKVLAHAIALRNLSPDFSRQGSHIWDPASASAVARSLIEAHDVLWYMPADGEGEDEREFRVLLWRLHDKQRRAQMLVLLKSVHPDKEKIVLEAQELGAQAMAHNWFPRLRVDLQQKIRKGDAPAFMVSQKEMNERNGVNNDFHKMATMWLSQYVHTFPMGIHQMREFVAGEEGALGISAMPVQFACAFLSNAIFKMFTVFPTARPDLSSVQWQHFEEMRLPVLYGMAAPE